MKKAFLKPENRLVPSSYDYDLLVIGGGIAGLTVASNVASEGKKVAIAEARDWGGTSINRGATAKKCKSKVLHALRKQIWLKQFVI